MSEKTKKYLSDYKSAIDNLSNVFQRDSSDDVVVDAGIKRFEIGYELAWKLIKNHLFDVGINCKNPRECFKEARAHNLINQEVSWLKMIEDRNLLIHVFCGAIPKDLR